MINKEFLFTASHSQYEEKDSSNNFQWVVGCPDDVLDTQNKIS